MSFRYYDSKGKPRAVSMFDALLHPEKLRAHFEAEKKRRDEKASAAATKEEKKPDGAPEPIAGGSVPKIEQKTEAPALALTPAPAPSPDAITAPVMEETVKDQAVADPDDVDVLQKEEKALQGLLKAIKARKAEAYKKKKAEVSADAPKGEKGKGKAEEEPAKKSAEDQLKDEKKKTKAGKKAEKKAAKDGAKENARADAAEETYKMPMFDDADHSDTDPNVPGIETTLEDFATGYEPPENRPNLTMYQCAQIMRLHEHYDYMKYLAIASKFYDLNRIRITPEEMADLLRCVTNPTSSAPAQQSSAVPDPGNDPSTASAAKEIKFSPFVQVQPLKTGEEAQW